MLPKQANPAFLVLAPDGKKDRSNNTTLAEGRAFLSVIVANKPTIPAPTIT
jgi:hypothetical protein